MYLIHGECHPQMTAEQALALLNKSVPTTLSKPLPTEILLACAERFVARLADPTFLPEIAGSVREEVRRFCQPETLRNKLEHELGESPFSLRRRDFRKPRFESWRPLGVVVHITPANAELLPFMATLESLLAGNINWLRTSARDNGLTRPLLQAFLRCDETGMLINRVAILPVATNELPLLLKQADGVSAWGGDAALDAIREQLPGGCRWIPWGHKISFAWLVPDAITDAALGVLADEICQFNQQACSSPQVVFVDTCNMRTMKETGERLATAMQRRHDHWPALKPDEKSAADITSMAAFLELDSVFTGTQSQQWAGNGWRILLQNSVELEPSPLYRTVLLRPLPRHELVQTLLPWRHYLQTCGLLACERDISALSQLLLAAGVNRVTPLGGMHQSYDGEPHDGVFALTQLTRRVSVTLDEATLPRQATLDLNPGAPQLPANQPIMDKSAFNKAAMQASAQLYFRSGGSSGVPKLSGFTYRDYHRQMQAAAHGMFAAGLDPAHDKVLNLMYAGNLYGGLLSFFTVLDKLGVTHLPMGGPHDEDYAGIAQTIVDQQVDTLIGMPSTLYQLFCREEKRLRAYGGVRKLLLGGEHMGAVQREFIQGFGIGTIRSALYGSVDAGPLGHACTATPDGVFHLMADIQWLEIVDRESDKPVAVGEVGRLLFTSRAREGQKVVRYEIGDLGRWIEGECPCGAVTPRFELLGRHGSLVRIGTMFIQPQRLAALAGVPVQLILDHNAASGLERIRVLAEGDPGETLGRISSDPELAMALASSLLELNVEPRDYREFERHPQSGKTPLVIDKRQ